jgi:hypothetical protein
MWIPRGVERGVPRFQVKTVRICQDLSAAAPAAALITEKSSESQSVDVKNKGMVNRYLRVFYHVSHFMTHNRT